MITGAQMRTLGVRLKDIATTQTFLPNSSMMELLRGLSIKFQNEFDNLTLVDNDLPQYAKRLMSTKYIKQTIDLANVTDPTNEGQVYLIFLLSSFYSVFIYSAVKCCMTDNRKTLSKNDIEMIGLNSLADKRLQELVKFCDIDINKFKSISLDKNQLAYLKASIRKIQQIFQ